jgi:hypothetical protein
MLISPSHSTRLLRGKASETSYHYSQYWLSTGNMVPKKMQNPNNLALLTDLIARIGHKSSSKH